MSPKGTRDGQIKKAMGLAMQRRRQQLNLTRPALAAKLGITAGQILKYESGRDAIPTQRVRALCGALQMPPNELFAWGEEQLSAAFPAYVRRAMTDIERLPEPMGRAIARGIWTVAREMERIERRKQQRREK